MTNRADGLEQLVRTQWHNVWGRTRDFRFLPDSLVVWPDPVGPSMVLAVLWSSVGVDAATAEPFERLGRATVVLRKQGESWQACHTHFSLSPKPERFLQSNTGSN